MKDKNIVTQAYEVVVHEPLTDYLPYVKLYVLVAINSAFEKLYAMDKETLEELNKEIIAVQEEKYNAH